MYLCSNHERVGNRRKNHFSSAVRNVDGFTLLELLIAISLSTILMTVLVGGLNQIARDWNKQSDKLENKIDESLLLLQLEKAILGTYPYRMKEQDLSKEELFFEGSKTDLSWVSTVSPGRNSSLTFWHLEAGEERGFKLTVLPIYPGNLYLQLEKMKAEDQYQTVYFEDYKISLHYLIESIKQKKQWETNWSAKEKNQLPLGVRIQFQQPENESDSDSNMMIFSFIRAVSNLSPGASLPFGGGQVKDIPKPQPDSDKNPLKDIFK